MKVLFIAQPFPYPPNTGSTNVIFHWLEAASQAHDVHLLWIGDPASGSDHIAEFPKVRIECVSAIPDKHLRARIRRLATAAVLGVPATSLVGMTRAARSAILRRVRQDAFDVAVLTENVVAGYAPLLAPILPVVLVKHSVQAVDARDARRRYGMKHPRWILEEWIVGRFEAQTCRAASVVCTVDLEDAADLTQRYRLARPPSIVPIGVDLSKFPQRERDPGGTVIGFFGNMSWGANVDAAKWFAEQILPKVWTKIPAAKFRIIGPGSDRLAFAKGETGIECRGAVSSIPDVMNDAAIGVVPVISGTGVRLKLLEMLSLGVPVVTTSLGALGTGCVNGEHVLIADDADSFSAAVVALLSDGDLRRRLALAGARLAQKHSWESHYPSILEIFDKAVGIRQRRDSAIGVAAAHELS